MLRNCKAEMEKLKILLPLRIFSTSHWTHFRNMYYIYDIHLEPTAYTFERFVFLFYKTEHSSSVLVCWNLFRWYVLDGNKKKKGIKVIPLFSNFETKASARECKVLLISRTSSRNAWLWRQTFAVLCWQEAMRYTVCKIDICDVSTCQRRTRRIE